MLSSDKDFFRIWFRTRTGAEALAVFNNPGLRTRIGFNVLALGDHAEHHSFVT
jgi:hypothetical protein